MKQVKELLGGTARKVASHRVISDLKEEGRTEKGHFSVDDKDYVNIYLVTNPRRSTGFIEGS
jgi:hypothetical protein